MSDGRGRAVGCGPQPPRDRPTPPRGDGRIKYTIRPAPQRVAEATREKFGGTASETADYRTRIVT